MRSTWLTRTGYVVLGVALVIRLASVYLHPLSHRLFSDMANYARIADDLRDGIWKPTHFFQPIGFSYILYLFRSTFSEWSQALGVYQSIISTATVWFIWKSAERSFGRKVGVASMIVASVHPPWLALNLFALAETTFTFLLSLLLWVSLKVVERGSYGWSVAWGLTFIAAFWVKGTHVFLGPLFLLGYLAWRHWSWQAITRVALPVCTVVATGLLLHGWLTYKTIGTFQMSGSAGGLNLVEGKCPAKRNIDSEGRSWFSPLYTQLGFSAEGRIWDRPFTDSSYFMRQGLLCIQDDPLILVQSLENIPYLFIGNVLWPANTLTVARYIRLHEVFWGSFLVTGLVLWCRSYWPVNADDCPVLLVWGVPIVALCLCVYVFKSEVRFRVPFDVFFIPVALHGWMSMLSSTRARR